MGVPTAAHLNRRAGDKVASPATLALTLALMLIGSATAAPPAGAATAAAARPAAAASPPAVVLPFPGLAPASTAAAKPRPAHRRHRAPPRPVAQAAPPPPPPPTAVRRVGDNVQVNLADLPASAREALLDLHDRLAAGGPCRGISLSAFELGVSPVIATQYNDDGRPDFFFHDPCGPRGARAEGSTLLLLSDPLGYHLSPTFAAALGEVDGRPVLLAHAPCDADAPPGAPPRCLLARFWDPSRRRWGDIQPINPDMASGGGPAPAPLSTPPAAPPADPQVIPAAAEGHPAAK